MTECTHPTLRCLNHYDTFRKYQCSTCEGVFICSCEKEMVMQLLPHQATSGREYGTQEEFEVTGFEPVCPACRGQKEEAHPRAQTYGNKKKLGRYYWREIQFTTYAKVLAYMKQHNVTGLDIFAFDKQFPGVQNAFNEEARKFWNNEHKRRPKYVYADGDDRTDFLKNLGIREETLEARYEKVDGRGRWTTPSGELHSAEFYVANHYQAQGYSVFLCERQVISTLVGAFLWTPMMEDDQLQTAGIGSKKRFSHGKYSKMPPEAFDKNGALWFSLPKGFGSEAHFQKRKGDFEQWLSTIQKCAPLKDQFDYYLDVSTHLREYLWVYNDQAEAVTRAFLEAVPDDITIKTILWAIGSFRERERGWPDLFAVRGNESLFIEVKGIHDKLSPDQMRWFEWCTTEKMFDARVVKLRKADNNDAKPRIGE